MNADALPVAMRALIRDGELLARGIEHYKELAEKFYFAVLFSKYRCPRCGGALRIVDSSTVACSCGLALDPTVAFQKSSCCQSSLVRKVLHYVCSCCGRVVPSLFLFDERLFDGEYFREMMAKSRDRKRRERLLLRAIAQHCSGDLLLLERPRFDALDGFERDLDDLIDQPGRAEVSLSLELDREFDPMAYWHHILDQLGRGEVRFSAITALDTDLRRDRAWRFVTLIYMEQEREVLLIQHGDDVLVERYEADLEG